MGEILLYLFALGFAALALAPLAWVAWKLGTVIVWVARRRAPRTVDRATASIYGRCFLCGQPRTREHSCIAWTAVGRSTTSPARLRGWVVTEQGGHWQCSHGHTVETGATTCAEEQLAAMQRGETTLPPVGRRSIPVARNGRAVPRYRFRDLCREYGGRCAYCGSPGPLQQEHVVPLARGGEHREGNIVPACAECNRRKGTLTAEEWVAHEGRLRRAAADAGRDPPYRRVHMPVRPRDAR